MSSLEEGPSTITQKQKVLVGVVLIGVILSILHWLEPLLRARGK